MRLPGHSPIAALLVLVLLVAGCSRDGQEASAKPWRVVAGDAQGAVVADGPNVRGVRRGNNRPAWEASGDLTGVACRKDCSSALLTFADRDGLFASHGGSVDRQRMGKLDQAGLRVLLASEGSAVLVQSTPNASRLLFWREGKTEKLRDLPAGSSVWRGSGTHGTLFLLGENSSSAIQIVAAEGAVRHQWLRSPSHGTVCYDSSWSGRDDLPEAAHRTLTRQLGGVSSCMAGPESTWVGVSNYLSMSAENPDGKPSVAVAVSNSAGTTRWRRTFPGERFTLSPEGRSLALTSDGKSVNLLDTRNGRRVERLPGAIDAEFSSTRELVTVNGAGRVEWRRY